MSELTDERKAELRHKWGIASKGDVLRLTDEEAEYLNELGEAYRKENAWPRPIPVSERLPALGEYCLAYQPKLKVWLTMVRVCPPNGVTQWRWYSRSEGECYYIPTHWLPLPPKPE